MSPPPAVRARITPMLSSKRSCDFFRQSNLCKAATFPGLRNGKRMSSFAPSRPSQSVRADETDSNNESGRLEAFRDIVMSRTSRRRFSDREIEPEVLRDIMALTQSSPSAFNVQPWSVVLVRQKHVRESLATAMMGGNTKKMVAAPVSAVFCADLEPLKRLPRMAELQREAGMVPVQIAQTAIAVNLFSGEGVVGNVIRRAATTVASPMQPMPEVHPVEAWSNKSTSLAAQTYMLACEAYGLTTGPMEGFDARRIRAALDIPDRYAIPMIIATGYPKSTPTDSGGKPRRWRYPPGEVVFDGSFGVPFEGIEPVVP